MDELTEGTPIDHDELTVEKLEDLLNTMGPVPKMPRWKDLTWAQRNMVEREIRATEPQLVRESMWRSYLREED